MVVGEPEGLLPAQGGRVPLPGCRLQGRGRVRRDVAGRLRDFLHLRVEEGGKFNILPGDIQRLPMTPFSSVLGKEYFDNPQRDSHAVHYI